MYTRKKNGNIFIPIVSAADLTPSKKGYVGAV